MNYITRMNHSMKRYAFIILFLLVFNFQYSQAGAEAPHANDTVMSVTLTKVRPGDLQRGLEVSGKVVPRDDVVVATELGGLRVLEVLVEEGEHVEKGQVLARLDTDTLKHNLESLAADLARTQEEFKRGTSLTKNQYGAISQEEADQRKTRYLVLQAQVSDATSRLRKAVIIAPVSGIIYQRDVVAGAVSNSDQPLFRIAANGETELEVTVPETFVHQIGKDTPVQAWLAGVEEKQAAAIRIISPRIDQITRTANIRISFLSKTFTPVGTFGKASFTLPAKKGLLLVVTAVQQDSQGSFVWVVNDEGMVARQDLTVVARDGSMALVEGVDERQRIVAKAGAFLQEGDRIKVIEAKS